MNDFLKFIVQVLNDNQGALIAVFTLVLVLINKILANETKRLRQIQSEPNLEVYLVPHKYHFNIINLVIRNSGGGPARNISWHIDCDEENLRKKEIPILEMSLFGVVHYMPAKEEIRFFFGDATRLLKEPEMKPIIISVSYCNEKGKNKFSKKFDIDLEPFKGMVKVGSDPLYDMSKSLEAIKKGIENICSGMKVPLIRFQDEKEFQKEQDERREEIKKRLKEETQKSKNRDNPL